MKQRHHTPEQVIRKLAEGEKLLNQGHDVAEVCRQLEITESTWHRWRNQYGGMKANDAKRLKELEKENASLKRIVANQALDIDMLKFVAEGKNSDPELTSSSGCRTRRGVRGVREKSLRRHWPESLHATTDCTESLGRRGEASRLPAQFRDASPPVGLATRTTRPVARGGT